ncbi:MAG: hypothetical protein A3B14_00210 [Candidatus Zambryskibacteria bacterium RIFCSPLOWO2_01_FULL_45_21]|uniref:Uncharacterized protein n=1 Tax=Candidatus Zambryskibacteria bacterium RIFCSPLOWO2_01_FULL_45_21 TaxID=1802761 RepID=A0A1G2U0S3_9BACT|nr:MAG: hypothetical protein A3B14_00210 [Candidatus Zambryskibacteria bacterium RIFCSPLOWO2_01_FULL_45_21]
MPKSRASPIRAVVDKVVPGKHGFYAVATPEEESLRRMTGKTGITFSLEPEDGAWRETEHPVPGDIVLLHDVRERRQGWRASRAGLHHLET